MRTAMLIAVALLASQPTTALAHALGVACKINGDKVEIEAFYDDDSAANKAKVSVVNVKNEVIASGVTDKDGKWSFATPAPGKYEIRVDAGAGHRAKKVLSVPGVVSEPAPSKQADPEPTRADMTRTPWLKIGIGLAAIALCSGAFTLGMMLRKNGTRAIKTSEPDV
jgi:hypothetical protein